VKCHSVGKGWVRVDFSDKSPRLPEALRREMFQPFSGEETEINEWMALFTAKMLVESRGEARLKEASDQLEGDSVGNQIQLYLPAEKIIDMESEKMMDTEKNNDS